MRTNRAQRSVVLTTTLPRSANAFYGPVIDEFRSRGYEVHVVTSDGRGVPRLRERADALHLIAMERTISPLADLRALIAWLRLLHTLKPDLVLGGTPKAALLGLVAARLSRVPRRANFLLGLRLEGTTGPLRRVLAAMERLTSWSSQVTLAVSPSLAARYQELHLAAGRPVVVPHHGSSHGVDSDHFSPLLRDPDLLRDLTLDPDVPVALFIGRLTTDKGPDALSGALDLLRLDGVAVQLVVLGAQDEEDSVRYRKHLEACPTPVRVIDHVLDVRPYLAAADLLVLPTRREGLPNVVLEAAAMGVPSVTTTATGAIDSVADGETGILVPPDDPQSLAAAMSRLLRDPGLRHEMGESARNRAVKLFAPGDVARAICTLALAPRTDGLQEPGAVTALRTSASGPGTSVAVPETSTAGPETSLPGTAPAIHEDTPRVSVLLPSLRADPWLRSALESILDDGYPNLEVILLLDGMTEVPADAWLRDPRVTCVPLGPRMGIARALNVGLELATSELVARMDGDDISLPGRLRAQVDFLRANSRVAVVGCSAIRIDEHDNPLGPLTPITGQAAIKRRLLTRNSLIHPTIMFRRSAVLAVGGYSTTARTLEDYDLYLRLAAEHEIANLPGVYLRYRVHPGQISRGFNPFSPDKWAFTRRRRQLARALDVPLPVQLTRDALWYGAQVARYLHLRGRS